MRTPPPALLPLLRSRVQGDVLALLYLAPAEERSVTEVARLVDASVKAVHQEVSRLVEAGLLTDRRLGTSRLVRAAQGSPLTRPLTDLLAVTYGPLPVLRDLLRLVPGVDRAYVYGSWAARYDGEPGPVPADVDVVVVGEADLDDLDEVARAAEHRLHREVNLRRIRTEVWDRGDDPFVLTVRGRPLVALTGADPG
jgi:DNA-binding transcriptional ArsR family regulator